MKKMISTLVTVGLLAGALAAPSAEAAKKKKKKPKKVSRAAEGEYTGTLVRANAVVAGQNVGAVEFAVGSTEKYASIEVVDATGQKVPAALRQDANGNGTTAEPGELAIDICGSTDKPVKIEPGMPLIVRVTAGQCGGAAGAATKGTVKGVFSNLP